MPVEITSKFTKGSHVPAHGGAPTWTGSKVDNDTGTGIRRLVYSPKAYVFIKDSQGNIHDLTHYVVGGQVDRLVDQVSTANITLRNPNHLFTVHVDDDGKIVEPTFSPMDPITIFLRRVRKHPVRVFTGFLDQTPYLQLYPGTITLRASCTLKRLLHTYFDPALPYTMSFLTHYGWIPYNGQWVSLTGMQNWLPPGVDPTTANSSSGPATPIGKGSKIALFGDSIAEGVKQSGVLGSRATLEQTFRGRQTKDTITAITAVNSDGPHALPDTVVVCSGSNDDPTDTDTFKTNVNKVLDLVGSNRHLIWVNLHGTNYAGQDLTALNPTLDEVAADHPNMTVIHWNTIVESENLNMDSHGLHTDSAGYKRLAGEVLKQADAGALAGGSGNKLQPPKDIDGSLTQLLGATLEYIGNWKTHEIYIEAMPASLFDHLRDLATEFAQDAEKAKDEFKTFIQNIIGAGSHGSPSGSDKIDLGGTVKGIDKITQTIVSIANKYNVDPAMAMATCDVETGYGQNMFTHEPYHGWYQIDIGGSRYSPPITVAQANDLQYACTLFCKGAANTVPDSAKKDPLTWAMVTQGVNGSNNPRYPEYWPTAYAKAKKLISQYGNGALSGSVGQNDLGGSIDQTVRSTTKGGKNKSTAPSGTYSLPLERQYMPTDASAGNRIDQGWDIEGAPVGATVYSITDGIVTAIASNGPAGTASGFGPRYAVIKAANGTWKDRCIYYGHAIALDTLSVGDHVSAGDPIGKLIHINGVGASSMGHIEIGFSTPQGVPLESGSQSRPADDHTSYGGQMKYGLLALVNGKSIDPSGGGGVATPGGAPANSTGDPGAAGAFFAALDLPSAFDAVEANMLTGEKSLLNDKPLLPFIQQLCSASLRHFQSLPDGRFYAFYPDYFGELNQHPPYWKIDDVEILDGGIDLTDDSLVTHEYVVGDTVTPMNGAAPFAMRSVFSSGVVTIFNAFMANSVLDRTKSRKKNKQQADRQVTKHDPQAKADTGMQILLDRKEVAAFLKRYGARPAVEDMPMIKSPYFEMFLAYQKFLLAWSKQFSTPFTFTFMPELFPGGKVAFPTHNLQMYIEQVTHQWDYESGFMTTASLTAPSAYGANTTLLPPNMVQAIIKPSINAN